MAERRPGCPFGANLKLEDYSKQRLATPMGLEQCPVCHKHFFAGEDAPPCTVD
jgi:hypothetical protein